MMNEIASSALRSGLDALARRRRRRVGRRSGRPCGAADHVAARASRAAPTAAGRAGAGLYGRRAGAGAVRADRERADRGGRRTGGAARHPDEHHCQRAPGGRPRRWRNPAARSRGRSARRCCAQRIEGGDHGIGWRRAGRGGRAGLVKRFDPRFWTVNFPRPMMASVVTTAPDALRVEARLLPGERSGRADLGGGGPVRPSAARLRDGAGLPALHARASAGGAAG